MISGFKWIKVLLACLCFTVTSLHAQVYLFENFNNGIDTTAGAWTIVNGGNTSATWFGTTNGLLGQYLDGSEFAMVNSDAAGSGPNYLHEELVSPVVNTAGANPLVLSFDQYFRHVASTDTGFVDVFDGTQWVGIDTFAASDGNFGAAAQKSYDITSLANANLQIRFVYDDDTSWAWYWGVDNVSLSTPASIDAEVITIVDPAINGRAGTVLGLSAAHSITIEVNNAGADTLTNIPLSYLIVPGIPVNEVLAGPLFPGVAQNYTFTQTVNLSALGSYEIKAWSSMPQDLNLLNDSALTIVAQLPNPPVTLPFCQDFELAADTAFTGNYVGMPGAEELDFFTQDPLSGRVRTGTGFSNSGGRAITLDRFPSGGADAINDAILTYNLAAYDANANSVELGLGIMEHGDEVDLQDSVWIRGCDTCSWIPILSWNVLTGGTNGQYFFLAGFDVSGTLLTNGQNFSSTFQVRIGQADNFDANSPTGSDGMSFDDLCLDIVLDSNVAVIDIVAPSELDCGDSAMTITVEVFNGGSDTMHNIPVVASAAGMTTGTVSGTYVGPLAPGTSDTLTLTGTINSFAGGTLMLTAYTQLAGEQLPADDTFMVNLDITAIPQAPQVVGDSVACIGGSAQLSIANPNPDLSFIWYDSLGGAPIASGPSVSLGPITQPATYYVNAGGLVRNTVGRPDNLGTGGPFTGPNEGLIFTAFREIVIDSVDVYPSDTGLVAVRIADLNGIVIDSVVVQVNPALPGNKITIPVGITVPIGVDYTMRAEGSTVSSLFRNSGGSVFPYTVQDVASITACINGLNTSGYYYFFYNWKVSSTACFSGFTTVQVDTTAFIATTAGFSTVSNGLAADFSEVSVNATDWSWDFGDGGTDVGANPSHSYASPGGYQVCVIATGPCASDTFCDSITVACLPLVGPFSITINDLTVNLMDSNQDANGWNWDFGDGDTASVQAPSHTYAIDGQYPICVTVTDPCGQAQLICDSVTVCGPINAGFNFTEIDTTYLTYDFFDASTGIPVSWFWDFGDGDTSSLAAPTHTYAAFGSYTVTLTVINLCGDSSVLVQPILILSAEDGLANTFEVYPNPSQGDFRVHLDQVSSGEVGLRILSLHGIELWESVYEVSSVLDLQLRPQLSVGTYFIELAVDGRRLVKRFVIQ